MRVHTPIFYAQNTFKIRCGDEEQECLRLDGELKVDLTMETFGIGGWLLKLGDSAQHLRNVVCELPRTVITGPELMWSEDDGKEGTIIATPFRVLDVIEAMRRAVFKNVRCSLSVSFDILMNMDSASWTTWKKLMVLLDPTPSKEWRVVLPFTGSWETTGWQ
ncbi:hypothetical protein LTR27_001677 [Elasticomyces elasticus]|nr:hypothetical protein LTR27_001677 [Elasticomyces elasticus]